MAAYHLKYLYFRAAYNKRGATLKHPMPGQALLSQGFPGIVYISEQLFEIVNCSVRNCKICPNAMT